jgi:hypothetical protein
MAQPCQWAAARSINSFLPKKQKVRLNAPPKTCGWIWFTHELLSSRAYRSLSGNAYRALSCIACEHMSHAGLENGRLKVTYDDFVTYGIRRNAIKGAIDELVASGLVAIARPGRHSHGEDRGIATEFRLTWLPVGTPEDFQWPTNQWKNFSPSTDSVTVSSIDSVTRPRRGQPSLKRRFSSV